jgi:hypothetical protein
MYGSSGTSEAEHEVEQLHLACRPAARQLGRAQAAAGQPALGDRLVAGQELDAAVEPPGVRQVPQVARLLVEAAPMPRERATASTWFWK